jgi:hypothetical protein
MRCWTISILVVLLGSSHIHSQRASDKVSYEGQTVAAVDLVATQEFQSTPKPVPAMFLPSIKLQSQPIGCDSLSQVECPT